MRIKEIIVVEGKADTVAVQRAVSADTIETGGSAIDKEVVERIRLAQSKRGAIVLTDPDYPGERIRRIIQQAVASCKHAFIPREKACKNGKVGVEYATPAAIRSALLWARADVLSTEPSPSVTWEQFISCGLTAHPEARQRREKVGQQLGIGYANARGFYKRLRQFRITAKEFRSAVEQLDEEVRDGREKREEPSDY